MQVMKIPAKRGTQVVEMLVDKEDYDRLCQFRWYIRRRPGSSQLEVITRDSPVGAVYHSAAKVVMNDFTKTGRIIDHINGIVLDNRKSNLRYANRYENAQNMKKKAALIPPLSEYKGVSMHKSTGRWTAYITAFGQRYNLGYFDDEVRAAKCYDTYARRFHGKFASLNLPNSEELVFDSDHEPSSTNGLLWINRKKDGYIVQVSRSVYGKPFHTKIFKTLEEAIKERDKHLEIAFLMGYVPRSAKRKQRLEGTILGAT